MTWAKFLSFLNLLSFFFFFLWKNHSKNRAINWKNHLGFLVVISPFLQDARIAGKNCKRQPSIEKKREKKKMCIMARGAVSRSNKSLASSPCMDLMEEEMAGLEPFLKAAGLGMDSRERNGLGWTTDFLFSGFHEKNDIWKNRLRRWQRREKWETNLSTSQSQAVEISIRKIIIRWFGFLDPIFSFIPEAAGKNYRTCFICDARNDCASAIFRSVNIPPSTKKEGVVKDVW